MPRFSPHVLARVDSIATRNEQSSQPRSHPSAAPAQKHVEVAAPARPMMMERQPPMPYGFQGKGHRVGGRALSDERGHQSEEPKKCINGACPNYGSATNGWRCNECHKKKDATMATLQTDEDLAKKTEMQAVDHMTLTERLYENGFDLLDVPGDNNCQFGAIADQVNQSAFSEKVWTSMNVRQACVDWLKAHKSKVMDMHGLGMMTRLFQACGLTEENWDDYISDMTMHGITWGDEATLLAASVIFNAEIVVISSIRERDHSVVPPEHWGKKLTRRFYIGHYPEVHFTSTRKRPERHLMDMGFDRTASLATLEACGGNVENAIDMMV